MARTIGKDVLGVVKKRTGKTITERDIQRLASGVKPSTMKSEAELRKLIRKVGAAAGITVSESLTKEIISAVKKSGMNPAGMEQMIKKMMR